MSHDVSILFLKYFAQFQNQQNFSANQMAAISDAQFAVRTFSHETEQKSLKVIWL